VTRTLSTRTPYLPTRLAFHASRIVIDVGVLLVLGAMSLPFVSAEEFGQRAVAADALPSLLPDHTRPVPTALGWPALLLALTALPYAVVKYLDASTLAGTLGGSVGMGARVLVFGAFVTLAGIVLGLIRNFLGLPVAGTYPARPEPTAAEAASRGRHPTTATTVARPPVQASGQASGAPPPRRGQAPGRRRAAEPTRTRPATTSIPAVADPPSSPPRRPPVGSPPPDKQSAPPLPPPAVSDPDTEPTLPGVARANWWPDDLEDLFS
jgi:hypothetical protein